MCQEMDPYHYALFYLTHSFATPATSSNSVDNLKITSMDNSTISSMDNSTIPSVDNFMIPSLDNSITLSVNSSAIPSVDPKSSSDSIRSAPSTITLVVPTILPKLSERNIKQQICSRIFNNKQGQNDLKR